MDYHARLRLTGHRPRAVSFAATWALAFSVGAGPFLFCFSLMFCTWSRFVRGMLLYKVYNTAQF